MKTRRGDAAGREPREPPSYAEGLGAHVKLERYQGRLVQATATVFSLDKLAAEISNAKAQGEDGVGALAAALDADGVIVGVIEVEEIEEDKRGPCLGSWQVSRVAGPGYAELLYGLGFALSPKGLLTSDRNEVALGAEKVWARQHTMGRRRAPLTPMSSQDRSSCYGYENAPDLNYVYEAEGWERAMLRKLESRGVVALSRAKATLRVDRRDTIDAVAEASWMFWQHLIDKTKRHSRFHVSRREW